MIPNTTPAPGDATDSGQVDHPSDLISSQNVNLSTSNCHDLWNEIREAVCEKEVQKLRADLQTVIIPVQNLPLETPEPENAFDLSAIDDLLNERDESESEATLNSVSELPLPQIHIHHHKRSQNENLHLYYQDQAVESSGESLPEAEMEDDPEWLLMEEALKEGDVMDLRHKLGQIGKKASMLSYDLASLEAYLNGEIDGDEREVMEEKLSGNPGLKNDLQLLVEVEEFLGEPDVTQLREKLGALLSRRNWGGRSLGEIEAFHDGLLSDSEMEKFLEDLSADSNLQKEVELVRQINEALREKEVINLRKKLEDLAVSERMVARESLFSSKKLKGRNPLKTSAAIILLLIGTYWLQSLFFSDLREPRLSLNKPLPAPSVYRDVEKLPDQQLYEGFSLYNEGYYASALLILKEEAGRSPFNPALHFYAGAGYQAMNDFSRALVEYDRVITQGDNLFIEDSEWYAALCLVGSRSYPDAVGRLEAIIYRNGFYSRKAARLLRDIKKQQPPS